MSDLAKVAAIFFGTIGAAAIIFQLNKGNLVQQGSSVVTSGINAAFTTAPSNSTHTKPTNKTTSNQQFLQT